MKVKSPSAVVWPALMPRLSSIALTMESEPQPPSWQGVCACSNPGQLWCSLPFLPSSCMSITWIPSLCSLDFPASMSSPFLHIKEQVLDGLTVVQAWTKNLPTGVRLYIV